MSELFQILNEAMKGSPFIALTACFIWGSFSIILSPCHLASIPLLVAYVNDCDVSKPRQATWISTVFAVGILITMALIGILTATAGRVASGIGPIGGYVVSGVFILIGLHLMDVISVPWFGTKKENIKTKGTLGALLLGLIFGVASGPCTFAFLAPVLAVAFNTASDNGIFSALLLISYAIGHCIVLIIAGASAERAKHFADWNRETKTARYMKFGIGTLLIFFGLYFLYKTI